MANATATPCTKDDPWENYKYYGQNFEISRQGVPTLLHLSRMKIRKQVRRTALLNSIYKLPVPLPLQHYIAFYDANRKKNYTTLEIKARVQEDQQRIWDILIRQAETLRECWCMCVLCEEIRKTGQSPEEFLEAMERFTKNSWDRLYIDKWMGYRFNQGD